jgi:AbrB family looped-hinge helix DNA binding protein
MLRYDDHMADVMVRIGTNGRFVLPAHVRRALGVDDGGTLVVRLVEDEVRLMTPQAAVRRAQRAVRPYLQAGRSLADELVAERRADEGRT